MLSSKKIIKKHNKKIRHKGFTLVELIVVMALLAILLTLTIFGVLAWQDYARFKQQNEYAETLFVAAQNQMAENSVSGKLKTIQEDMTGSNGSYINVLDVTTLKNGSGEAYDLTKVWPESVNKDNEKKYQGTICYVSCNKGDYKKYLKGEEVSDDAKILFELLGSYVYDTSILDASICVEFSLEDGQIFAVLYSDRATGFVYDETKQNETGYVDISNRELDYRKDRMVGYYGVDTLTKATSIKTEKPSISSQKLNNEETLNLSFKLSKVPLATQELIYEIVVYDKDTTNPVLSISLDGSKIKNKENASAVSCPVKRYTYENGTSEISELGAFDILAWVETDRTVRVILDAADIQATTNLYTSEASKIKTSAAADTAFAKTYSFFRFGVPAENIYCTVQGSGTDYKTTAKKQSNVSSACFAVSETQEVKNSVRTAKTTKKYSIKNARHLYNVRYIEDTSAIDVTESEVEFVLANDVDWKKFMSAGNLFDTKGGINLSSLSTSKNEVSNTNCDFPSFKKLREQDTFSGNGYTIKDISMTEISNALYGVYNYSNEGDKPVGLFVTNFGKVTNLVLDDVYVKGNNKIGSICGENAGVLESIEIANSNSLSVVEGKENVGGVFGYNAVAGNVEIKGLVNRATVRGIKYVGGIVGKIHIGNDKDYSAVISDCENYGIIEADDSNKIEARYIGGITGFLDNETENVERLVVKNCVSSPEYDETDLNDILDDEVKRTSKLYGVYVGGIVGFNHFGKISNCSTESEEGKTGYIFGYQYVGGIVGFNQGPASGIEGGAQSKRGVNQANVIGYKYVGGITGCNADALTELDADGLIVPSEKRNLNVTISKWINKGVVLADGSYAGGITGYNTGWIYNCNSDVDNTESAEHFAKAFSGDYAGGIAGYNNGIIGNTNRIINPNDGSQSQIMPSLGSESQRKVSAVCYISGKNYVGGIVGYNDVDAIVEDYELAGGFIKGSGSYVGGYAGLNLSNNLLVDENGKGRKLAANPNEVSGKYFIGGSIGGNILIANSDVNTVFETDNFLGKINAEAFAGGFIGYNLMVKAGDLDEIQAKVINSVNAAGSTEGAVRALDNISRDSAITSNKTTAKLKITGEEGKNTQNKLGGITGKLYLGGVMGYNDANTWLYVENVTNTTPVKATEAMENAGEQPERNTYAGKTFKYSYAGGVIGKVNVNVTIYNCKNADVGNVVTVGTYTGGLCEINEGNIISCYVSSIGGASTDYVGGICGVNKKQGTIKDCIFIGKTVTGRNYVGGITAENFGKVTGDNMSIGNAGINSSGNICAGLVGHNYETGIIDLSSDVTGVEIQSSGNYIGSVAGINEGIINNNKTASEILITGSVQGNQFIGGVVGENRTAADITNFKNEAVVTAENGNAGGILGNNKGNSSIISCINKGAVITTKSGRAGGITAENEGLIKNCTDYGTVTSPNGECGGITAVNNINGQITGCVVKSEDSAKKLNFSAKDTVGGITAINNGTIENSSVADISVFNYTSSGKSNIGAFAGINNGKIKLEKGDAVSGSSVGTYTNNSNVGGIAGSNNETGTIEGISWYTENEYKTPETVVKCDISYINKSANVANLGGVAGKNTGSISNIAVISNIEGNLGSEKTGYGGIAGYSAGTLAREAKITNCTYDGDLYAIGSADGIARVGGIAGVNQKYSEIEGCRVGVFQDTSIKAGSRELAANNNAAKKASFSYLGGIAGANYGDVISCDSYSEDNDFVVEMEAYAGMEGGIVGFNFQDASVTGTKERELSTGKNWKVTAKYYCNDAGTGGIIGYSASGKSFLNVKNYAAVTNVDGTSNVSVGGFIGRNENKNRNDMKFENCINYGNIKSAIRAAGYVGTMKFTGAEFNDCINMGTIDGQVSGGLVAIVYQVTDDELYFNKCINHGKITGSQAAGGLVGRGMELGSPTLYFSECVNTGIVTGTTGASGICGEQSGRGYFYRCRNYASMIANGITKDSAKEIVDCLDLSGGIKPFVGAGVIRNNYFINESSLTEETGEDEGKTTFSYITSRSTDNMKDSLLDTYGVNSKRSNYNGETIFYIHVESPATGAAMDKYVLVMANNGSNNNTPRNYKYTAIFYDTNGDSASTNGTAIGYYEPEQSICEIPVPEGVDKNNIEDIEIKLSCTNSTYINIRALNWIPVGETERQICESKSTGTSGTTAPLSGTYLLKVNKNEGEKYNVSSSETGAKIENLVNNPCAKIYYNDTADYSASKTRIPTYEEIDPKYLDFIISTYTSRRKLLTPTKLTLDTTNGIYRFTWENTETPYGYEVKYTVIGSDGSVLVPETTEMISARRKYEIIPDSTWENAKITFSVRAVNGYEIENPNAADKAAYSSDWTSITNNATIALPTPRVHLEMVGTNSVIAVLDNAEDYKTESGYLDCSINVTGPASFTIKPSDGYSTKSASVKTGNNFEVSAYAKPNSSISSKYGNSMVIRTATALIGNDVMNMENQVFYTTSFNGFYGATAEALNYQIAFIPNGNTQDYYVYSDIMAYDDEIGTEVSYSYGLSHVTRSSNVYTSLTGFPTDFLGRDRIIVKTYIWSTQANAMYYGHEVAEKLTAEEVKSCVDDSYYTGSGTTWTRTSQSIWNGDALKPGYVIYANEDGTYNVNYSVTIAYDGEFRSSLVKEKEYVLNEDKSAYVYDETKSYPLQKAPIIDSLDINDNEYTFTWDTGMQGADYKDAVYSVELTGIAIDGKKVPIKNVENVTTNKLTFIDANGNWNYPTLVLNVVRTGTVNAQTNKTTKFPNSASKEFSVKIRLSTIAKPVVELAKNNAGQINKNEMKYEVTFDQITSELEKNDLGGYLIMVEAQETEGITEKTATHYYFVNKLDGEDQNVPEEAVDVTDTYKETGDSANAIIDLSDFARGEIVHISVKGIAKNDAENYRDGADGVIQEITLPKRLAVPEIGNIEGTPVYGADSFVTMDEYLEKGITITLNDENNTVIQGKYQIAIAVFDEKGSATDKKVLNAGDAPEDTSTGYWNSGAIKTICSKSGEIYLNGNFESANITLGSIASEYAGKWLKITARSTSDSNVSSWWADEDPEADATVDYKWIQIPRIQLEEPLLTQDTLNLYYNNGKWSTNDTGLVDEVPATVTTLNFEEQDYEDGYKIQIVGAAKNTEGADVYYPVSWVYIDKNETGSMDVYYSSNETGNISSGDATKVCKQDENAKYVGSLTDGQMLELPYYGEFYLNTTDQNKTKIFANLIYSNGSFELALPDMTELDSSVVELEYEFTQQVSVQAVVDEEKLANYENSLIQNWYRSVVASSNEHIVGINSLAAYDAAPTVTFSDISTTSGYQFKTKSDRQLVAELRVMDAAGEVVETRVVAVSGQGIAGTEVNGEFKLDNWTYFTDEYNVEVRFAGISGSGTGISEWTEWSSINSTVSLSQTSTEVETPSGYSIGTDELDKTGTESGADKIDKDEPDKIGTEASTEAQTETSTEASTEAQTDAETKETTEED